MSDRRRSGGSGEADGVRDDTDDGSGDADGASGDTDADPRGDRPVPVDHAFRCEECGRRWYYDRHRCPDCGGAAVDTYELGVGELVARTTVEMTPPDVRSPNRLGIARFGDVQLTAQLADEAVAVGDSVAFAGEYRLREGRDAVDPRLTAVDDGASEDDDGTRPGAGASEDDDGTRPGAGASEDDDTRPGAGASEDDDTRPGAGASEDDDTRPGAGASEGDDTPVY